MTIGDSQRDARRGGTDRWKPRPSTLYLYVNDTDATYRRAIEAGASFTDGRRPTSSTGTAAGVEDPAGNFWWIATHVEDVSPEEMHRRAESRINRRTDVSRPDA